MRSLQRCFTQGSGWLSRKERFWEENESKTGRTCGSTASFWSWKIFLHRSKTLDWCDRMAFESVGQRVSLVFAQKQPVTDFRSNLSRAALWFGASPARGVFSPKGGLAKRQSFFVRYLRTYATLSIDSWFHESGGSKVKKWGRELWVWPDYSADLLNCSMACSVWGIEVWTFFGWYTHIYVYVDVSASLDVPEATCWKAALTSEAQGWTIWNGVHSCNQQEQTRWRHQTISSKETKPSQVVRTTHQRTAKASEEKLCRIDRIDIWIHKNIHQTTTWKGFWIHFSHSMQDHVCII